MTAPIRIGDTARTLGPLKPTGRISVHDQIIDASSEGAWIDSDAEVVIVGGNSRRLIVREPCHEEHSLPDQGNLLPERKDFEPTPLRSPPAWVERINSVAIGFVVGIALALMAWLSGVPFSLHAFLLPASGAIAGWVFRVFVGTAIESVGPREDHRSRARGIAMFIVLCCLVGSAVGLNIGLGFLGLCCGVPLGALAGGILSYIALVLSHFIP